MNIRWDHEGNRQRKILDHYFRLKDGIGTLQGEVQARRIQEQDLADRLKAANEDLNVLYEILFRGKIEPLYYNERRRGNSAVVQRVLSLPELVDLILASLDHPELLRMSEVSKSMRDMIEASPSLQLHLSHIPSLDRKEASFPFAAPPFGSPTDIRFICDRDLQGTDIYDQTRIPVSAKFTFRFRSPWRRLGARWRKMFICHPPLLEMRVEVGKEDVISPPVRAKGGITIGDLYDNYKWLREEYGGL